MILTNILFKTFISNQSHGIRYNLRIGFNGRCGWSMIGSNSANLWSITHFLRHARSSGVMPAVRSRVSYWKSFLKMCPVIQNYISFQFYSHVNFQTDRIVWKMSRPRRMTMLNARQWFINDGRRFWPQTRRHKPLPRWNVRHFFHSSQRSKLFFSEKNTKNWIHNCVSNNEYE